MATTARPRARDLLRRRQSSPPSPADLPIAGTARLGRRTKELVRRLGEGDVAVLDHPDLDRIAAEDLVARGVAAVVNVAPSSTGRYPNAGPLVLARAGVRLVDVPAAPLFEELRDGDQVVIRGGELRSNGTLLATGRVLGLEECERALERQRDRIDEALAAFAANTMDHMRDEAALLAGGLELPRTRTRFRDRHVLIVVRGTTHRRDLRALRAYIDDVRPILVGVDGGADAILEAGRRPDMIVGEMDSASDRALRSGAELIIHAYPDGRAPGRERVERLGLPHREVRAVGTSQDLAMLLAYEQGAALIVSVGAHFNLVEFLDRSRNGMSSTFLTRLRIGEVLVDAKGVSRLYNRGPGGRLLAVFLSASLALIVVVVVSTPSLSNLVQLLWLKIRLWLGI
jgi:uncharacterized membrane-anchored protein